MRRYRAILVIFLIACLTLSTACSKQGDTSQETSGTPQATTTVASQETTAAVEGLGSTQPLISENPIKLTVFQILHATAAQTTNNMADNPVIQELAKRTNVQLEFIHPVSEQEDETLGLLLASGDYPDVIRTYSPTWYKGGFEGAIEDDVVIDATEYIEKYAPNFMGIVAEKDIFNKLVRDDKGRINGFGSIFYANKMIGWNSTGPVIRQDWLNEVGMDLPITIDDWHKVLTAFKDKLGCKTPLMMDQFLKDSYIGSNGLFATAYGVPARGYYQVDGVVKFAPIQPEYKNFLTTMAQWYNEGLINKDFATNTLNDNVIPMLTSGQTGACAIGMMHFSTFYDVKDNDTDKKLWPTDFPVLNKGDKLHYRNVAWGVSKYGGIIYITTANKYPVETVKFFDYIYSPEGNLLATWGVKEGETYITNPDGSHKFTELITKNPDGLSYNAALYKYTLSSNPPRYDWDLETAQYSLPEHQASGFGYWSAIDYSWCFPESFLTMTEEESETYNRITTQTDPYVEEMVYSFIMGRISLNEWDKYVETLKSMDIEKAVQIKQQAYDRFVARD